MRIDDKQKRLPEDMSEDEYNDIQDFLHKFEVKYPDAEEISQTVESVSQHLRALESKAAGQDLGSRLNRLLRLAASEISVMSRFYWFVSAALYISAYIAITQELQISPSIVMFILAPLPFILGLAEVFRSRDARMLELEMSCAYHSASILLAKLCIVGAYNILLNVLCSILFSELTDTSALLDITLLWMMPFTIISGLSLTFAIRMHSSSAIMLLMTLWLFSCLILLLNPALMRGILTLHTEVNVMLIVIGMALTYFQVKRFLKKTDAREGWYESEAAH